MPAAATHGNLIGNQWTSSSGGQTFERRNPAKPDEIVAVLPLSGAIEVREAVAAAAAAYPEWSRTPAPQRGELLMRAAAAFESQADAVAEGMAREMGKPLREARGEAARVTAILRYFAGEPLRPEGEVFHQSASAGRIFTIRRPLGVVGLITPWNFPAAIPAWKLAPALAYGNTVVLKAARDAPLTALAIGRAFVEAGLPAGVLNVVVGPGATAGAALVASPHVAAISFTGSVETGSRLRTAATAAGKRVQLELGGQNPLIVTADADLGRAVEAAFAGAFWSAGQKCTATRRIYVERPAYEEFRSRFLERVSAARVGDPLDPGTEVGPLVNEDQLESVLSAIEHGRTEGGTLVTGGERRGEGWFVTPAVFEGVADDATLSCEEVFGPVVSLYPFETLDEALRRGNAVAMGLSASIFTSSLATVERFTRELQAGILHVNSQTAGAEVHVPFGGIKGSGWGPHEQGRAAIEFYTDVATVYVDP
jgi:alpha-ketoglutaric semialdehyde dehydrogenase